MTVLAGLLTVALLVLLIAVAVLLRLLTVLLVLRRWWVGRVAAVGVVALVVLTL